MRVPLELSTAPAWRWPEGLPAALRQERTLLMGVLNVTPDSFSDGGAYLEHESAIAHAEKMVADGADIIDVGGESTRPGAARVSEAEERRRTIPVVRALAERGICVSIDTMRAEVAREAVQAGALIVNDVSGGLADPEMLPAVAHLRTSLRLPPVYVAMHWRAHSHEAVGHQSYADVGREVAAELGARLEAAREAGIPASSLVADPGFGFSKSGEQNWELLAKIEQIEALGFPLLIGVSRKRFLAALGGNVDAATAAISGLCQARHAWAVRVHDVPATLAQMRVVERLVHGPHATGTAATGPAATSADRPYPDAPALGQRKEP